MNLLPIAKVLGMNPRSVRGIYTKYYSDEKEAFYGWLNEPNEALENQTIVLLESTLWINQVMTELGRIEHGIFA